MEGWAVVSAVAVLKELEEKAAEAKKRGEPERVEEMEMLVFSQPGDRYEAIVEKIERGRMRDFIDIDAIENEEIRRRMEEIADSPAVRIVFKVPQLGIVADDVIRISFHQNSRYIQLGRCYDVIKVGDKIYVELTEKGRIRIICPPRTR